VPGVSPIVVIWYDWLVVPDPSPVPLVAGTRVPNVSLQVTGFVVEIRNKPVVASPFGLPEPFSAADVLVTDVAAEVEAVGAAANATLAVPSTSSAGDTRSSHAPRCAKRAWVLQRPPRRCPKLITAGAQSSTHR